MVMGRTDLPAGSALLDPELDRFLSPQLPAKVEQQNLPAGLHRSRNQLQALAPAVVVPGLDMERLATVTEPALRSTPQME